MKYSKGVVEARINSDLKDMMVQLNGNHTKILEKYIFPMSSIYAKRLYELLSEYKGIGYRNFILEDLYDKLQVSKALKDYSNFKKKVLVIAVEQINLHSDLYLDLPLDDLKSEEWVRLQCMKTRGITHLNFHILDNPNNVDELALVNQWVDRVKAKYPNEKIMRYQNAKHNGYICTSTPTEKGKGRMYIQDLNGNSTMASINKHDSLKMWTFMYKNQDKLLIGNVDE
jgi:plasmid replication initiation protein